MILPPDFPDSDAITIRGDSIGTAAYSCTGSMFKYRIYGGISGEYGYYGLDFIKAFATRLPILVMQF